MYFVFKLLFRAKMKNVNSAGGVMIFQLNNLNITPDSFRLLYSILTAAYHDKMWQTTYAVLERDSKLSRYKVRAGLDELRKEKLITTQSFTTGIKITLMPILVEMIYKDFKRRGASQRTRNMTEIKKYQAPQEKQGAVATKTSRTSSRQTSTQSPPQNISKPSLRNTSQKEKAQTQQIIQPSSTTTVTPSKPPSKPPTNRPPGTNPTTSRRKLRDSDRKLPYLTTKGSLYKTFEEWLKGYERLSELDITRFMKDETKMLYYWKQFHDYARCWLSRNRQLERPDMDLNKIKMMKKMAALAKAA